MTDIYLHGQLSEQFPEMITMSIRKASEAASAIDAVYDGFRQYIVKLANAGIHYAMVIDGRDMKLLSEVEFIKEPNEVHFVPIIGGSGPVAAAAAIGGGLALAASTIGAGATMTFFGMTIATSTVLTSGLMIAGIGLQMLLTPKPDMQRPESAVSGLSESSFLGSSQANLMTQGSPLPIGYGRLRVGSAVINVTSKSFQTTKKQRGAMLANSNGKRNANSQISTKQGNRSR